MRDRPHSIRVRGGWSEKGCGAKQAARYARQISAAAFNYHHDNRMAWNETVYPRVLKQQAAQRRHARGW